MTSLPDFYMQAAVFPRGFWNCWTGCVAPKFCKKKSHSLEQSKRGYAPLLISIVDSSKGIYDLKWNYLATVARASLPRGPWSYGPLPCTHVLGLFVSWNYTIQRDKSANFFVHMQTYQPWSWQRTSWFLFGSLCNTDGRYLTVIFTAILKNSPEKIRPLTTCGLLGTCPMRTVLSAALTVVSQRCLGRNATVLQFPAVKACGAQPHISSPVSRGYWAYL